MGTSSGREKIEAALVKKAKESLANFERLKDIVNLETDKLLKADKSFRRANQAQKIIQEVAKQLQENISTRIADIVTRCIKTVFQDDPSGPYEFQIEFERKRGKTEARLFLKRGNEKFNPVDEAGGGIVDVVNFALRVACICMEKPHRRKILFLDEPFKFVSEEYRPFIAPLLRDLASELDFQIVMVTHIQELQIGKVVNI